MRACDAMGWWRPVIDRAEDGDGDGDAAHPARNRPADAAPDAASASGDDAPGDAALPGAAERAAAHCRYRELIDDAYGTARGAQARDAWAEALPELRDAWGKHEEKYPERSRPAPRTQPDGGWEADGNRRLNPDQNAEASRACADVRKEGADVILPAMERVEAVDPNRRLAGLDHMLKGEDRLKEKIADVLFVETNLTARQAADKVSDAVRFTFTYSEQRYAEGVLSDVERLKSEGFELIKLKNLWAEEQYKGINSQWRSPETGLRFEMQFHTPESLAAKELTHEAYERLRSTQVTQVERDELEDYQKRVNTVIATPLGATEIEEFPRKHG
jgi:hypothetical protein